MVEVTWLSFFFGDNDRPEDYFLDWRVLWNILFSLKFANGQNMPFCQYLMKTFNVQGVYILIGKSLVLLNNYCFFIFYTSTLFFSIFGDRDRFLLVGNVLVRLSLFIFCFFVFFFNNFHRNKYMIAFLVIFSWHPFFLIETMFIWTRKNPNS